MWDRLTSRGRALETWRWRRWMLVAALPGTTLTGDDTQRRNVPMRDVAIRGSATAASREIALIIQSVIGTPIGRVPVNAYLRLTYNCESQFTAAVSYHPLVRLFAKVKGVDLIARMDGSVSQMEATCPVLDVAEIRGRAKAEAAEMSGYVWLGRDSLRFRGPAWMLGDTSYHSVLSAQHHDRKIVLRVNMYER